MAGTVVSVLVYRVDKNLQRVYDQTVYTTVKLLEMIEKRQLINKKTYE